MLIVLYCLAIALVSLGGGYLPLSKRITHLSLQIYLSLSAGAMLGAAFFHMLPESAERAGHQFGWWMAVGVIGLYMIERFLSPHSHDTDGEKDEDHDHHHEHEEHSHGEVEAGHAGSLHPAAPQVAGWSAVAGLSIHTVLGGVALGSAVLGPESTHELGLAVFLATLLHKPADALTISALLTKGGTSRQRALLVQCFFALLIPAGVLLFGFGQTLMSGQMGMKFTGCVLAFSAGTFICIALSDLLPEVQFHSHDRAKLFVAVLAGAGIMWLTSLFEPSDAHGHACHPVFPRAANCCASPELAYAHALLPHPSSAQRSQMVPPLREGREGEDRGEGGAISCGPRAFEPLLVLEAMKVPMVDPGGVGPTRRWSGLRDLA